MPKPTEETESNEASPEEQADDARNTLIADLTDGLEDFLNDDEDVTEEDDDDDDDAEDSDEDAEDESGEEGGSSDEEDADEDADDDSDDDDDDDDDAGDDDDESDDDEEKDATLSRIEKLEKELKDAKDAEAQRKVDLHKAKTAAAKQTDAFDRYPGVKGMKTEDRQYATETVAAAMENLGFSPDMVSRLNNLAEYVGGIAKEREKEKLKLDLDAEGVDMYYEEALKLYGSGEAKTLRAAILLASDGEIKKASKEKKSVEKTKAVKLTKAGRKKRASLPKSKGSSKAGKGKAEKRIEKKHQGSPGDFLKAALTSNLQ